MSDEDIETSECQFGERDEDYGDGDVAESATGDVDDYADDGDDSGVEEDEPEDDDDDDATEGSSTTAAPAAAQSIGMITDLESCRLFFRTLSLSKVFYVHMCAFFGLGWGQL